MSIWSNYILAHSIDEALQALASAPGPALPIAGGTDLLLELQQGAHAPVHTLVDLTRIPELTRLEQRSGSLYIGAAVPVREVTTSPLVREHAPAVAEACGLIGGPQVRNSATLGGNVAHALPAADGMIALAALDAQAEIASPQGRRMQPLLSLFRGPGLSTLQLDREILVGFHMPLRQPGEASVFARVMRPQGVALPILNAAAWLRRVGDLIDDVRLVIGPSGPVPRRAPELEQMLIGTRPGDDLADRLRDPIRQFLRFRTSPQRASAEYRYALCEGLLVDVLEQAWKRAEMEVLV